MLGRMPRLSIRVDLGPGLRIGPGKIALLETIDATGSISAAGRKLGMSYRRGLLLVREVERSLAPAGVAPGRGAEPSLRRAGGLDPDRRRARRRDIAHRARPRADRPLPAARAR